MTEAEKQLLIDNTVATKEILVVLKGTNGGGLVKDVEDGKNGRTHLHKRIDGLEQTMVTEVTCAKVNSQMAEEMKRTIQEAITNKKRATGLLIKDIILGLLGTGGVGTMIVLALMDKL